MKIVKTASGKQTIKMSKNEWKAIGKKAGWMGAQISSQPYDAAKSKQWAESTNNPYVIMYINKLNHEVEAGWPGLEQAMQLVTQAMNGDQRALNNIKKLMMPDPAVRGMAEKNDPFWPKDDKYNSPEGVQNLINMK